ncbi:LysR family transcriptional regulator [Actinomadura sp. NBRC 104412]|uniref:LysR substrate-binding domain-containing protein n=1 Tax=Actinomadura sp. NBRC 104412 TaxID=3032203 RepID=UPI002555B863|nr:LysR family transcriptional regulator [Actinomadura sp. NBRC 104412]
MRGLRAFVAVAEELSFTRAAERMFISQPALSKQIRQLEDTLRVRLLERDRRTVTLTAPGRVLLPAARELLDSWDRTRRAVAEAAADEAAVLTVGLATSVGRGLLAPVRPVLARRWPGSRLRPRQIDWDDPSAGLADGQVDVAFVWLPLPPHLAVHARVVAREQRWVAFHKDHWLAGRDQVAFAELLDEPFVALVEAAGPQRDHWLALDQRGGHPVKIGATVANADETFTAIEQGSGIVLLAAGNVPIYQRPEIGAIPVTGLPLTELAVAWRADDGRALVRDFVDTLAPDGA